MFQRTCTRIPLSSWDKFKRNGLRGKKRLILCTIVQSQYKLGDHKYWPKTESPSVTPARAALWEGREMRAIPCNQVVVEVCQDPRLNLVGFVWLQFLNHAGPQKLTPTPQQIRAFHWYFAGEFQHLVLRMGPMASVLGPPSLSSEPDERSLSPALTSSFLFKIETSLPLSPSTYPTSSIFHVIQVRKQASTPFYSRESAPYGKH